MDAMAEPEKPVHFPSETVIYRQFAWTRHHPLDLGDQPVLPAAHGAADLQRTSGALYRRPVGLRVRQRRAEDRRGKHRSRSARLHQTVRREVRHKRRARHVRPGGAAALRGVPGLGDDPVAPRPRHRPRHPFLLRMAAGRHAARLAGAPASSTAISASWCRRSATSSSCRATSPTMRG